MKAKESWFKRNYRFAWILNFIFLMAILLLITNSVLTLKYSDVFNFYKEDSVLKQHSESTYKFKITSQSIILGQNFNQLPSKALIEIYTEDFNKVHTFYSANNFTFKGEDGKYYGKITKTVDFNENNASETRYTWILFELKSESENEEIDFIISYDPQIWEEEPSIRW